MSLRSILCDWLAWLWPFVLVKKEKDSNVKAVAELPGLTSFKACH